jgi:hypothetical protein
VTCDCAPLPMHTHQRQEPFFVVHKTITKPSTFVQFVIKFVGVKNLTNILSLSEPHNN